MNDYVEAADLRTALRRFLRRAEEIARRHHLTPRQYVLLLMIRAAREKGGYATITDLVDRLALTQSTITELVQRADEAGLVTRAQSPVDGRVIHLDLSELGTRRLEAAFTELGPERETLLRLLRDASE